MAVKAGYKKTEIGVIPENWFVDSIDSVPPKGGRNGIVDGPFGSNLKTIHYRDSGIPIITSGYVTEGVFLADSYLYVDKEKFDQEKRSSVAPGDIVMAKIGARCGASAILPDGHEIGILSGNALKISVDGKRHSKFYIWQVLWDLYKSNRLDALRTVGAQPAISMANLKKFKIPLPPLSEQTAIATALSDVDALIAGLEKLIAKKRDLKQAAMQQLLTGQTRLPGFTGEWMARPLGSLGTIYGGLVGKSKTDFGHGSASYVPFVNVMANIRIDCGALEPVNVSSAENQNRVLFGDLLFNGSSETPEEVALCALMTQTVENLYLNSFCFGFRFKQGAEASGLFLTYLMRSQMGRELMKSLAQGSTRYNLSKSALLQATLVLPSLEEQIAIAIALSDMDADLAALDVRLQKTRDLKQGMMQELLTGRTRLV